MAHDQNFGPGPKLWTRTKTLTQDQLDQRQTFEHEKNRQIDTKSFQYISILCHTTTILPYFSLNEVSNHNPRQSPAPKEFRALLHHVQIDSYAIS